MRACEPLSSSVARESAIARRPSILIIDDDPDVRQLVAELLTARGYVVAAHANGAEALAYLRSAPRPQAILLDLNMPVMDGFAFRAAQSQDAALAAIPVVVISDQATFDRGRLGTVDVLPKPFKLARLVDVLEHLA